MPESPCKLVVSDGYRADRPYGAEQGAVLSLARLAVAKREITAWPGYQPTPLVELPGLAAHLGLGGLFYKDESQRFGLGSFKAVGGAYGVLRVLQTELERRGGSPVPSRQLFSGMHAERVRDITVSCATDGNHGRAVAWAAEQFGCAAVIYVPEHVSDARQAAIAAHGATVHRIAGTYDDAVRQADEEAVRHGRVVVSDQSYAGYEAVPADIMQGYALVAAETLAALPAAERLTHIVVQAGVGGFAAAVCAYIWERLGPARPDLICVEPAAADCLLRTAAAGRPVPVPGSLDTVMGCLSCGEASPLAWRILEHGARAYLAIDDQWARRAMCVLSAGTGGDPRLVAGESGAAGVAGLLALGEDPAARRRLGLTTRSRVLVFGTEGATDPESYSAIVGSAPDEVGGVAKG